MTKTIDPGDKLNLEAMQSLRAWAEAHAPAGSKQAKEILEILGLVDTLWAVVNMSAGWVFKLLRQQAATNIDKIPGSLYGDYI